MDLHNATIIPVGRLYFADLIVGGPKMESFVDTGRMPWMSCKRSGEKLPADNVGGWCWLAFFRIAIRRVLHLESAVGAHDSQ